MSALSYEIFTFKCRTDNVGILLHDPATHACAAIDAPETNAILKALEQKQWTLTHLLVTHSHPDHLAGIDDLSAQFKPFVAAPLKMRSILKHANQWVKEGDEVSVGRLALKVWETPGHLDDLVIYLMNEHFVAFVSDNLSPLGCGRVDNYAYANMFSSLQRIKALPSSTLLYYGHDYALSNAHFAIAVDPDNQDIRQRADFYQKEADQGCFTAASLLSEELKTNPFLKTQDQASFQALREWKNRF